MGGSFGRPLPSPLPSVGGAGTTSISRASVDKGFSGLVFMVVGKWTITAVYSNKGFIDHKGTFIMVFGKGTIVILEMLFVDYNFLHGVH